ncbi:hypothetical protein IW262DRAFT_1293736 [Armillaria fumosa]|nr:hypothetical protein IW262DRAFT_1293736 [Armillaria fumosa]
MSWTGDACNTKVYLEAPENICAGLMTLTAQQSFLLFGVNVSLFIYYVLHRFRDSWSVLCLVTWISIVELFTTATHVSLLFEQLPSSDDKTLIFAWTANTIPLITVSLSLPVQLFLIRRVNELSKSLVLTGLLGLLSLFSAVMSFGTTRIALAYEWPAAIYEKDITLDLCLRIATECAILVAIFCIGDIIFATALPPTGWRGFFEFSLSRLYSTTFFATLNARAPKEAPDLDKDAFEALIE